MNIQSIWNNALHLVGYDWWVKVTTDRPHCTYYFGPFVTKIEAATNKSGYIEDLESELAAVVRVEIARDRPVQLTIKHESEDLDRSNMSSQLIVDN